MPPCVPGGLQPCLLLSLHGFSWMSLYVLQINMQLLLYCLLFKNTSFSSSGVFQQCLALFLFLFQQKAQKIPVGGVSLRHHLDFASSWTLTPSWSQCGCRWVSSEVWTLLENVRNWLQTGSSKKISGFSYWNTHSLEGNVYVFKKFHNQIVWETQLNSFL